MRFVLVALLLCLCLPSAFAQSSLCRLYLADQSDYAGVKGFYLDFEGSSLADLPVFLAVADGTDWRFPNYVPGFAFDRDYHLQAVIAPEVSELYLDDVKVIESAGSWTPAPGSLRIYERPGWANEPGDWVGNVSQVVVTLTREGSEVERHEFAYGAPRPTPLLLFQPDQPSAAALAALPGDTVTIDVLMRFSRAELDPWKPFIDEFEQCRYADWPEKVTNEADLVADIAAEDAVLATMPPSTDYDQYGGYLRAGWSESPTGFFRAARRDGYWWLITPLGNPCFYLGVSVFPAQAWDMTGVTGRESLFSSLPVEGEPHASAWSHDVWGTGEEMDYFSFYAWNLIRKYGDTWWSDAEERGIRRLRHWAFSGGSKWGAPETVVATPVLGRGNTPSLVDHPDIFDPAVQSAFRDDLAAQITPRLTDPYILGWSVGSERPELITREEVQAIMALASTTPGKRAILDYAVDQLYGGSVSAVAAAWGLTATTRNQLYALTPTPTAADLERMRQFYLDRYYRFCYQTVKAIDPNHLYLGNYLCPVCDVTEASWRTVAQYCDVISYDFYRFDYDDARLLRLEQETDKPVFCGEFSFPEWYDGWRGFGRYWTAYTSSDAESGERYAEMVSAGARDPYCVGMSWFQYHDQPLTGRGPGVGDGLVYGEHYAFGLVTVTDRPKWDQVIPMREANLQAAAWRLSAPPGPFHDIAPTHWAAEEIGACSAAGIVRGYEDGTYRPGLAVTRDQMAVYVSRALAGGDEAVPTGPATATFSDVLTDHWAYKYVEYAYANGVVVGYSPTVYAPTVIVDRGQMAVFIARAMVGGEAYVPTGPETAAFPDVQTDHWAFKYVEYIRGEGVTGGYPDSKYHPEYDVTRDQMAVFVQRAFDLPM
jgi:hypothetical protein